MSKQLTLHDSEDIKFTAKHGLRRAFKKENNTSTLRYHCHLHYDVYKDQYTKGGIDMHRCAVPDDILKEASRLKKNGTQGTLDLQLLKLSKPQDFMKEEILRCVAQFIVCDDQVSVKKKEKWPLSEFLHPHHLL